MSKSRADALADARAKVAELEAAEVIEDPDGHFPYRLEDAVAAGADRRVAEAAQQVVKADEARRRDPSQDNERAYSDAVYYASRLASERRVVQDTHEEHGVDESGFRVLRRKRDGALTAVQPGSTSTQGGEQQ